jgi:hypothetical protein
MTTEEFQSWPKPASLSHDAIKLGEKLTLLCRFSEIEVTDEAVAMALSINSDLTHAWNYLTTMIEWRNLVAPDNGQISISEQTLGWKKVTFLIFYD